MIDEVLRFNASETPTKMGTFPQYAYPHTLERYAEVADYLGIKGKNDKEKLNNLIKAIDELKARVGIKPTIKDYVPDEKISSIALTIWSNKRLTINARAQIRDIRS